MKIRKAEEKDIPRIMELLGQVLQIHAEIRPDVFIPGTTKYTDSELKELLEQEDKPIFVAAGEDDVCMGYAFCQLKEQTCAHVAQIQKAAAAVAQVDVLTSFAVVAAVNGYCMPQVDGSDSLSISEGRHPVVEKVLPAGTPFVPNDTHMDSGEDLCAIITGPNMAGKSTYMRQVALIVLMAQMGSFVPARSTSPPAITTILSAMSRILS